MSAEMVVEMAPPTGAFLLVTASTCRSSSTPRQGGSPAALNKDKVADYPAAGPPATLAPNTWIVLPPAKAAALVAQLNIRAGRTGPVAIAETDATRRIEIWGVRWAVPESGRSEAAMAIYPVTAASARIHCHPRARPAMDFVPDRGVLTLSMVDPGVVVQKIIIDDRRTPESCFGPPESLTVQ